jgi:hypothetical protein
MSDENILISEIIDTTFDNNDYTCPIGPQSVYIPTTGPTGPTGPPCENVISFPTFINAYSTSEQKIEKDGYIIFDYTNSIYGNSLHIPKTSEIYIWKPGYYSVYTSIYHMESCQFSLLKNSQFIAPVSTVGSFFGSSQNTNYFIIQLTNQDMITPLSSSNTGYACKLQLINNTNTSYIPYVTLIGSYSAGNLLPQITASITIQSIV